MHCRGQYKATVKTGPHRALQQCQGSAVHINYKAHCILKLIRDNKKKKSKMGVRVHQLHALHMHKSCTELEGPAYTRSKILKGNTNLIKCILKEVGVDVIHGDEPGPAPYKAGLARPLLLLPSVGVCFCFPRPVHSRLFNLLRTRHTPQYTKQIIYRLVRKTAKNMKSESRTLNVSWCKKPPLSRKKSSLMASFPVS